MRKTLLTFIDIFIIIFVFGGLFAFGYIPSRQQPTLVVVLILGSVVLVILRLILQSKARNSEAGGRDDQQ
ncbi:MAG: hypothetical protein HND56_07495 [Pseudomonadota bacterium]|nr:MAG: hypothetical protein HND56_07495 [Pseudomonadota bacterium]